MIIEQLTAIVASCVGFAALLGAWSLHRQLTALRKNAYLRTEKGHLRRYSECSAAVRSQAESN